MPASKLKPFVREQMNVAYESGRPVLVEIIDENTFQEELANAFVPPKPKPDPVITKPAPVIEKPAPEIQEPYTVLRRCFVRASYSSFRIKYLYSIFYSILRLGRIIKTLDFMLMNYLPTGTQEKSIK